MYHLNRIKNKKIAYLSLGCKVNAYETEAMEEILSSYGAVTVDFKEAADIYVVNTCTVTNVADRKSRQTLHRARKQNPQAVVAAVGCYTQAFYREHIADETIDLLIGNRRKSEIADILDRYFTEKEEGKIPEKVYVSENKAEFEPLSIRDTREHTRAFIKIQDGCNQFCSYCIIPYARGRIVSRSSEDIIREATELSEKGFREIVLTGIHISSYGFDDCTNTEQLALRRNDGRLPFIGLLRELQNIPKIDRIRLGSLEPRIITEKFCRELSGLSKVCPHFHLSLQSGSDRTLKAMNRRYGTADYEESVALLRKYFDNPAITTDIIAGFPGENEEDFLDSLAFAEKIGFSRIHVFPYSRRKGTVADRMENQVSDSDKKKREKGLLVAAEKLRRSYELSLSGKVLPVLLEEKLEINGESYTMGHVPQYVRVVLKTDRNPGEIVNVRLTEERLSDSVLGIL